MELKRCVRCGKFYATDVEVCHECEKKDVADLSKLKVFFSEGYTQGITRGEISASTGISAKNLNRYLNYEEFSGIFIPESESISSFSGISSLDSDVEEIKTKV